MYEINFNSLYKLTEKADIRVLERQFGFIRFKTSPFSDLKVTKICLNGLVLQLSHLSTVR